MKLVACSECARHIKGTEPQCPFCDARTEAPVVTSTTGSRVLRAAMLAGAAATVGVACGGEIAPSSDASTVDATKDTGAVIVPYGVPPSDASTIQDVTIAPPYGHPPQDQ